MTAPTPTPDPTGKRAKLSASRTALSLAVAAAIAAGVLLSPKSPQPGSCAAGRTAIAMRAMDTATAYSIGDTVFVAPIQLWPPDSASRAGLVVPADSSSFFSGIVPAADSTGFYVIIDSGHPDVARAVYCAAVDSAHQAKIVARFPPADSGVFPAGAVH